MRNGMPSRRRPSRAAAPTAPATLAARYGRPIPLEATVDLPRPTTPPGEDGKSYTAYLSGSGNYIPRKWSLSAAAMGAARPCMRRNW